MKQPISIRATRHKTLTLADVFAKVHMETLCLKNRTLAWENFCSGDTTELEAQIAQYNEYIEKLENHHQFCEYFAQHDFCLEKSDVVRDLGEVFAEMLFSLQEYPFETVLSVQGDWFAPLGMAVDCAMEVAGEIVTFTVGESNNGYPSQSQDGAWRYLWDWSADLRDFTFYLYQIFDELGLLPEETEDYDDYECYDQGREVMNAPNANLADCFHTLELAGYVTSYTVACPQAQAWFHGRGRQDSTIGFAMLNDEFCHDVQLMAELRKLLAR